MNTTRNKPTGRRCNILVCGELLEGIKTPNELFVVIESDSTYTGGLCEPENVRRWISGRWVINGLPLKVYDTRPLISFV